ncbi:MAG: hypothetical protein GJU76_14380 [Gallionella sp.]|jgi:C4-dicarboxylate-specific signal transduction histidine kinase|nr:hypothetical protein [Gallionella sp.]
MNNFNPIVPPHNPRDIVIRLIILVIVAEFMIMLLIGFLAPRLTEYVPDAFWDYADSVLLALIIVPASLQLVWRPMEAQQLVLERQNDELNRLAAKLREDESLLTAQHQQALDNLQNLIEVEKLSSLGTMVGGVAHEINNPLMGLLNYIEFAHDHTADPKTKQVLDDAMHEIQRIKKIVANMLVFLRSDVTHQESCSAQDIVARTLVLLESELRKGAVQVDVDMEPYLPPVKCDAGSLQQVLVNLILNARDALAEQAEQHIRITGVYEDGQVVLSVCDNGPGIPEAIQDKIFDHFFTTKPAGKGTGLGLSVSRHLVEAAGGTIKLYSKSGYGCCFRVTFDTFLDQPE